MAMPGPEATLDRDADGALRLTGRLGFDNVAELQGLLTPHLGGRDDLVIDLGGVVRSDSAGLALLVGWLRLAHRAGARLRFRNMPAQLTAMAKVSQVHGLLDAG